MTTNCECGTVLQFWHLTTNGLLSVTGRPSQHRRASKPADWTQFACWKIWAIGQNDVKTVQVYISTDFVAIHDFILSVSAKIIDKHLWTEEGFWLNEFYSNFPKKTCISYTAEPIVVPNLQMWPIWNSIVITLWNNNLLYF